jgi:wyosine [tRNA(Phe)-imidazoG37] synthetase (radical SAM superfamily)
VDRLRAELDEMLSFVSSEGTFEHPSFADLDSEKRKVRDLAFSGDGEPTSCPEFVRAVEVAAEARRVRGLWPVKLVLITNATLLDRPEVQKGLEILDQNNGEIWAKLDAGTAEYYSLIARTKIPFRRVLDNILLAARQRPIVIQSLFMRVDNQPPPPQEIAAYCERLSEITAGGGQIKLVQVYTIARRPAEAFVSALTPEELTSIAQTIRERTGLEVASFGPAG